MKRYIKSAIQNCPILLDWLSAYRSSYDVIILYVDGKRLSIPSRLSGICCHELKRYLTDPSYHSPLYQFKDYLVVDTDATGNRYTVDIVSPN